MHKLPAFVFKTLGVSLVLMFLLDTTLVVIDTISVHSKVLNVAGIMQNEVARNNSMPKALADTFEDQLDIIVENSKVATSEYRTNMRSDITYDGITYRGLDEDNPADYGELIPLHIEINMQPAFVYLNTGGDDRAEKGMIRKGISDSTNYTLTYDYIVPCLRYLK